MCNYIKYHLANVAMKGFCWFILSVPLWIVSANANADVYFKNKSSQEILDVKGASSTAGAVISQYFLNYTKAQRFSYTCQQAGCPYILIRTGTSNYSQPLYLSLKAQPVLTNTSGISALNSQPASSSVNGVTSYPPPVNLGNSFIITQEARYRDNPASVGYIFSNKANYQHWKLVPVANEPMYYFIQSMAFTTPHYLQPANGQLHAALTVAPAENGSDAQKWFMGPTDPYAPNNLSLTNLRWENFAITGDLNWTATAQNEDGYNIWVRREESSANFTNPWRVQTLMSKTVSTTFSIPDNNQSGQNKRHCFYVQAFNRWGSEKTTEICAIPINAPTGVSKVSITNCHNQYKSVHLWLLDGADPFKWKYVGFLPHQWNTTSTQCPVGNSVVIPLTDGVTSTIKALDCSDQPPDKAPNCNRLNLLPVRGWSGGTELAAQVR